MHKNNHRGITVTENLFNLFVIYLELTPNLSKWILFSIVFLCCSIIAVSKYALEIFW